MPVNGSFEEMNEKILSDLLAKTEASPAKAMTRNSVIAMLKNIAYEQQKLYA